MKIIRTLIVAVAVTAFCAGTALSAPQTICPVMGGKINKEFYDDYQGKRVYFCCAACIPEFKKDPAKYIKKLEDQGVELEKAPCAKKQPKAAAPAAP